MLPSLLRLRTPSLADTTCYTRRLKLALSRSISDASITSDLSAEEKESLREKLHRQRKTEWKRRQGGQSFLDYLIVNVRGGNGGNGCAAFHREKFVPHGPPSGGDGGRGGDVYIIPTPHMTTLSSISKKIRGEAGGHGRGTWQGGKSGSPTIIKVPLGTVVRELARDHPLRAQDEWEAEEAALEGLPPAAKRDKMRENRWVHYPRAAEDNVERDSFKEAEQNMYKVERERRLERRRRTIESPIDLDLSKEMKEDTSVDAPLGTRRQEPTGHLVASGGQGGLGNTHFITAENRSPKFATRGQEGERVTLILELKLLADIGLVGMPNAGKSTLLRALTGGRVKSEVASYAFTTLNPVVGVVRVAKDGTFEGSLQHGAVYGETAMEREHEQARHDLDRQTITADAPSTSSHSLSAENLPRDAGSDAVPQRSGHYFDAVEDFRFTISDNPGLISRASDNVGLGHSFLRAMERSLALAYVVDFSQPAPWDELKVLKEELEQYKPGMSEKARIVIANKGDLLASTGDASEVEEAKAKLKHLEEWAKDNLGPLDVVAVSGKYAQNLTKVVRLMRSYVEAERLAMENNMELESTPSAPSLEDTTTP
ncbi:OBG-type GTPase [Pleurotus pulmonarius]